VSGWSGVHPIGNRSDIQSAGARSEAGAFDTGGGVGKLHIVRSYRARWSALLRASTPIDMRLPLPLLCHYDDTSQCPQLGVREPVRIRARLCNAVGSVPLNASWGDLIVLAAKRGTLK
jgi:hypothetical protein